MSLLDKQGLQTLVDNINKEINKKVNTIKEGLATINDSIINTTETWSSSKIKDYVDNSTPTIPDFTSSEISYGKNDCDNVDIALDEIFNRLSNGGNGEVPVVSNVEMKNLTASGTYDLTYTVTGGSENAVYAHRITIDSVNYDIIPFKDGNTYTYHGTNLTPGKTQICRVFVSDGNVTSSSELFSVLVPQADIYGIAWNSNDSNPYTSVSYIEGAVGLNGATSLDLGDWEHRFPFNDIKPCGFKDGKVVKYIDKNNFKKYVDGTDVESDVDVMIQIPKIYWNARTTSTGGEIRISPVKKNGYECYAHNQNGHEKEYIYIGAYLSTGNYDSVSGSTPQSVVITDSLFTNITAKKGAGYTLYTYHMNTLLQILYMLLYKRFDTQYMLGTANGGVNGETDSFGMIAKTSISNKFLGLQNVCGFNRYIFLAGATYELYPASVSSAKLMKMHLNNTNLGINATYDSSHTPIISNFYYNLNYSSSGYTHFKEMSFNTLAPFLPTGSTNASDTTYSCSRFNKTSSSSSSSSYSYLGIGNYGTLVGTTICSKAGSDSANHDTLKVSYRLAYI